MGCIPYIHNNHTAAYIMLMCESVNSWIVISLTVISFESLNSYELDPEALVTQVHQRHQTKIKAIVSCANDLSTVQYATYTTLVGWISGAG